MKNWDKILADFARKCKGGAPDMTNPRHLALLRESLIKFGWNENATNEILGNLREKKKPRRWAVNDEGQVVWRTVDYANSKNWPVPTDDQMKAKDDDGEGGGEEEKLSPELQEYDDLQKETADKRDKGEAGAGGQSASQGESRYCDAVDNLDYNEFKDKKENKTEIENRVKSRKTNTDSKGRVKLSTGERNDLEAMGFDPVDSDEALEYLATREVWAEEELARIKKVKPKEIDNPDPPPKKIGTNVFYNEAGFDGNEEDYKAWMRAAFDGALATKKLLKESRMNTDKPHRTIQSTKEVDNTVQTGLQNKLVENLKKAGYTDKEIEAYLAKGKDHKPLPKPKKDLDENLQRDIDHYKKELKSFKKFRKYHDTYAVGQDKNGNTFIVSISNKKDSGLNDPQNNTTPAQRFALIKEKYGKKVVGEVIDVLDAGIKRVTTVQEATNDSAATHKVDDDFVQVANIVGKKYLHGGSKEPGISGRGKKRERYKKIEETDDYKRAQRKLDKNKPKGDPAKFENDKQKQDYEDASKKMQEYEEYKENWPNGKPRSGQEFGCWLEEQDPTITPEQWESMSDADKLAKTQEYMRDEDYAKKNGKPPYSPFAKLWIKVGEAAEGGRGIIAARTTSMLKTLEKNNPKAHKSAEKALKDLEDRLKPKKPSGIQKEAAVREVYNQHKEDGGKVDPLDPEQQASSVSEAGIIKSTEAQAVNEAHAEVVNTITEQDKKHGYPKKDDDGKRVNGPRTQSYIETVMGAMHFESYIMMDDDEDDKMIVQMGIRGAKPSHIRNCLAEKSGYPMPPKGNGTKEGLVEHIKKTSQLDVRPEGKGSNGAIVVVNETTGKMTTLMDDTWRTAGTSQKVASGFGDDMKECIKDKVDADRKKNRVVGNKPKKSKKAKKK